MARTQLRKQFSVLLRGTLYWSGLGWCYSRFIQRHGAIVLMYHSVADAEEAGWIDDNVQIAPKVFDSQMQFLVKHRNVVSLRELVGMINRKDPIPQGSVVITFDDAYRNSLNIAAPILEKYRLPATFFVPTGILDREENMWCDELHSMFKHRTRSRIHLICDEEVEANLDNQFESVEIHSKIEEFLIEADRSSREALLQILRSQLKPSQKPPRLLMNWEEVRALQQRYKNIEIGGHSHDHLSFDELNSDQIHMQIQKCIERIRDELSLVPNFFSYPYNRFSEMADQQLAKYGVIGAVADGPSALVTPCHRPLHLPRINPKLGMTQFRFLTSGAYPGILRTLKCGME